MEELEEKVKIFYILRYMGVYLEKKQWLWLKNGRWCVTIWRDEAMTSLVQHSSMELLWKLQTGHVLSVFLKKIEPTGLKRNLARTLNRPVQFGQFHWAGRFLPNLISSHLDLHHQWTFNCLSHVNFRSRCGNLFICFWWCWRSSFSTGSLECFCSKEGFHLCDLLRKFGL